MFNRSFNWQPANFISWKVNNKWFFSFHLKCKKRYEVLRKWTIYIPWSTWHGASIANMIFPHRLRRKSNKRSEALNRSKNTSINLKFWYSIICAVSFNLMVSLCRFTQCAHSNQPTIDTNDLSTLTQNQRHWFILLSLQWECQLTSIYYTAMRMTMITSTTIRFLYLSLSWNAITTQSNSKAPLFFSSDIMHTLERGNLKSSLDCFFFT